jgi:hypothetical protein
MEQRLQESVWRRAWKDAWAAHERPIVVIVSLLADLAVGAAAFLIALSNEPTTPAQALLFGVGGAALAQLALIAGGLVTSVVRHHGSNGTRRATMCGRWSRN